MQIWRYQQIQKYDYIDPFREDDKDIPMEKNYTYFERDLVKEQMEIQSTGVARRVTVGKLHDGNFFLAKMSFNKSSNYRYNEAYYDGYPVQVFDCRDIEEFLAALKAELYLETKEAYKVMENFIPDHELVMYVLTC
jgi:hypothetical protein